MGSCRPPKGFSSITSKINKLETPNFAKSNFNNIHIREYNQSKDFFLILGEGEGDVQVRGMLEKCQNFRCFDIFWGILDKGKGTLGQ